MKKLRNLFIYGIVLFLINGNVHAQSGWVREKGSYYVQLSYTYLQSNNFFNLSGNELQTNVFSQHSVNLYGEYGLTNRLTVGTFFPVFRSNQFETTDAATGIGDLHIQLKYALIKGSIPVAIIVTPEIPTAQGDNFAVNQELTFERINLPTGDGEFNVWTTLAASHSFEGTPIYASIYGGYNFRTSYRDTEFNDQIRAGIEVGIQIHPKILVQAQLAAYNTLGDEQSSGDFIRADGLGFTSYGLGVYIQATSKLRVLLQAQNYFDGIYDRRNLYSSPVMHVGIAWERK